MCTYGDKLQCYLVKYCYKCIKCTVISGFLHFPIISCSAAERRNHFSNFIGVKEKVALKVNKKFPDTRNKCFLKG